MSSRLPSSIWALGFVSLFMDVSSETVHGLLPVFLVTVLGTSRSAVGLLEGVAEGAVLVIKVFSGSLSDMLSRRKPLVVLGYVIGALSKPFFALAGSFPVVFAARVLDRVGKGIRGAPRDALIADLTPTGLRGRAYGLRQSLDSVGAFLGPILAIVLMSATGENFRLVFGLATIPGAIAVLLLVVFVKEPGRKGEAEKRTRVSFGLIREFNKPFWLVVGAGALFQLARFSEAFLILRADDLGLPVQYSPAVLIVMNILYSVTAYPAGLFSDRHPRAWFLMLGVGALLGADMLLAMASGPFVAFAGVALWGVHLGLTQGVFSALIADASPPEHVGTAFGVFNLASALCLLVASAVAGILWDGLGASAPFYTGAGVCLLCLLFLFVFRSRLWAGSLSRL